MKLVKLKLETKTTHEYVGKSGDLINIMIPTVVTTNALINSKRDRKRKICHEQSGEIVRLT